MTYSGNNFVQVYCDQARNEFSLNPLRIEKRFL